MAQRRQDNETETERELAEGLIRSKSQLMNYLRECELNDTTGAYVYEDTMVVPFGTGDVKGNNGQGLVIGKFICFGNWERITLLDGFALL